MVSHVGLPPNIAWSDIYCLGYRLSQWQEQDFSFSRDGKFTYLFIRGVKNLIWRTVMGNSY
jgi:hypothetical protein